MLRFSPGGADEARIEASAPLRRHGIKGRLLPARPQGFPMWLIDVSQSRPGLVEPLLSEAEQERALRFKSAALRRRYTIGHGSLRVIIRDIYGISVERQELSKNEFGKPFLTRFPQLHFSISYSGEHVLIGVNEGAAIGVDIEIARIIADASDLSEFHYTMREREEMCRNGPSEAELSRRFLNVWVKKEACVKALGRGLGIPLNEVECGGGALEATVQLSERQHYRTGIIQLRGDPILAWARSII